MAKKKDALDEAAAEAEIAVHQPVIASYLVRVTIRSMTPTYRAGQEPDAPVDEPEAPTNDQVERIVEHALTRQNTVVGARAERTDR